MKLIDLNMLASGGLIKADNLFSQFGAEKEFKNSNQETEQGTNSVNQKGWPSGSETSKIKALFTNHLMPAALTKTGTFADFVLENDVTKVFGRITHVEYDQLQKPAVYEFLVPRLKGLPSTKVVKANQITIIALYYFVIPLYIVDNETSQLQNSDLVNNYGFALERKNAESMTVIPLNDRSRLPWIIVVSSRFFDRLGSKKREASLYLGMMATGSECIIVNYQPFAGHALKDELQLNLIQEAKYIREAHNLDRLLKYINNDFEKLMNRPLQKLLS